MCLTTALTTTRVGFSAPEYQALAEDKAHLDSLLQEYARRQSALDQLSDGILGDVPVCGDGILQGGEFCDDGNLVDGDGCSSVCGNEVP